MHRRFLVFLLVALFCAPLFGSSTTGYCPSCDFFEIGGEALYWRPTLCELNTTLFDTRPYAAGSLGTADELPRGVIRSLDPDLSWGWRAWATLLFVGGCFDLAAQYTWLRPRETETFHAPLPGGIWPINGQPRDLNSPLFNGQTPTADAEGIFDPMPLEARANGHLQLNYDSAELQVGGRMQRGCDLALRIFGALHWAEVEHRFSNRLTGTRNPGVDPAHTGDPAAAANIVITIDTRRKVWGLGPKLGLEIRYYIAQGFAFMARCGAGLIVGEQKGSYQQTNAMTVLGFQPSDPHQPTINADPLSTKQLVLRSPARNHLIPLVDARLGLSYAARCGCFTIMGEIGYEFLSYINAIGRNCFNDIGATKHRSCVSLNFDGLCLLGRLLF